MTDTRDLATAEPADLLDPDLEVGAAKPAWRRLLESPRTAFIACYATLLACGAMFFIATGPLWFDEAQTVAIARRSFPHGIFQGLREDGSPPLYYLLLHGWMALTGTGTFALRSLSGIFAVASVGLIALAAKRIPALRVRPRTAALLFATCPFVVRYATETRMYSFELFLVLLAILAFDWVWSRGGAVATIAAGLASGALLLTQYWALYGLVLLGAIALVAAIRGVRRAWLPVISLLIGAAIFSPWLPAFIFQSKHTGAPWDPPPGLDAPINTIEGWAGGGAGGAILRLAYFAAIAVAIAGFARAEGGLTFRRPVRRVPTAVFGYAAATLVLGTIISEITANAFAARYSMIILPLVVLVIGTGLDAMPKRIRKASLVAVCALALLGSVRLPGQIRTQAGQVAAVIKTAPANSMVVFCPDQLGPSVHRLLPTTGTQVTYPNFGSPAMIDWVDYKARNQQANPRTFAKQLIQRANGAPIYFVYMPTYPILGRACEAVYTALTAARGVPRFYVNGGSSEERDQLAEFRAAK